MLIFIESQGFPKIIIDRNVCLQQLISSHNTFISNEVCKNTHYTQAFHEVLPVDQPGHTDLIAADQPAEIKPLFYGRSVFIPGIPA